MPGAGKFYKEMIKQWQLKPYEELSEEAKDFLERMNGHDLVKESVLTKHFGTPPGTYYKSSMFYVPDGASPSEVGIVGAIEFEFSVVQCFSNKVCNSVLSS